MRRILVPLLLSSACSEDFRWVETRASCGFEYQPWSREPMPEYPSEGCVDRVLDDFGVDRDQLLEADGLDDPYGLVWGEDLSGTATGALLSSAHALLTFDLGPLHRVDGRWATPEFLEVMDEISARTGRDEVVALLYDYVSDAVGRTTAGSHPTALAGMKGHQLILYDLPSGIDGAAVLVHEARHRTGPEHLWCGGQPVCDRDATGSWGFEMAVHEMVRDQADDELLRRIEQSWLDAIEERIVGR